MTKKTLVISIILILCATTIIISFRVHDATRYKSISDIDIEKIKQDNEFDDILLIEYWNGEEINNELRLHDSSIPIENIDSIVILGAKSDKIELMIIPKSTKYDSVNYDSFSYPSITSIQNIIQAYNDQTSYEISVSNLEQSLALTQINLSWFEDQSFYPLTHFALVVGYTSKSEEIVYVIPGVNENHHLLLCDTNINECDIIFTTE